MSGATAKEGNRFSARWNFCLFLSPPKLSSFVCTAFPRLEQTETKPGLQSLRSIYGGSHQNQQCSMERKRLFYLLKKQSLFPTSRFSSNLNIASATRFSKRGMADIRSPSEPRVFPSSGWDSIDTSLSVEEETIPTYRPEKFYPVHIGEVFNHRYQVVGKMGYGSSATVWLCRDLL